MNYLIFFDINGTLIQRDARTDLPYGYAIDEYLDLKNGMEGVDTSARSDHDVFMEILENHKLEYSTELWQGFLKVYEKYLIQFKDSDVWRENASCVPFVKALKETNHHLSLITGELSIGAQYKLEKLGIWDAFITGGFGEDGLKRFDIADAALAKMQKVIKDDYDEIYIIGDTLLDIKTARHLGAKVISITTGSNTREELVELKPDMVIDEFKEIEDLFL